MMTAKQRYRTPRLKEIGIILPTTELLLELDQTGLVCDGKLLLHAVMTAWLTCEEDMWVRYATMSGFSSGYVNKVIYGTWDTDLAVKDTVDHAQLLGLISKIAIWLDPYLVMVNRPKRDAPYCRVAWLGNSLMVYLHIDGD